LIDTLNDREQSVPYIHIFALIGYLKQLCDHPCLVLGEREGGAVGSAKWDLFCELLAECIESEQKVVVFSQYLGMIEMISRHLQSLDIDHEVLTGSSTNRGQRVRRFQEDESCRVFVGSLKAGGVGVDLTAASAVIHYDRWWNAAVEDQASDRVHRMGQDKAVQVFRLLTRESIEERIDAIITRKRSLSESILPEDSATALKSFSREELLEILRG
jgi:SNF2 family DNA or RNA helicase